MYKAYSSNDYEKISEFIISKKLTDYADRSLCAEAEGWKLDLQCSYLEVIDDEEKLVAVCKYNFMTEVAIDFHIYVDPNLWGTGKASEIEAEMMNWFYHNTAVTAVTTFCPSSCKEVHAAAVRTGYTPIGIIPFGIVWKNNMEDIYIFNKTIWRI